MTNAATKTATRGKAGPVTDKETAAGGRGGNRRKLGIASQDMGEKIEAGKGSSGKGETAPKATGAQGAPAPAPEPVVGTDASSHIKITVVEMPGRGGRPTGPEIYPFGTLGESKVEAGGKIVGPSFFIPKSDGPQALIANARKRYKGTLFYTRKTREEIEENSGMFEDGVRIWRGKTTIKPA